MHTEVSDVECRPLRADAERNRLKIIAAAHALFAERGLDVSMDDVAERAGVGVGTVYRRFTNRDDLVTGVFTEHLKRVAARADEALDDPDPWSAVEGLLTWFCTVMAEDRGLAAIIMRIDHSQPEIEAVKAGFSSRIEKLIDRAMAAGVLRSDLASTDVFGIFTMISAVADAMQPTVPGAWRRYLELILRAIHADADDTPIATPALTDEQLRDIQRERANRQR